MYYKHVLHFEIGKLKGRKKTKEKKQKRPRGKNTYLSLTKWHKKKKEVRLIENTRHPYNMDVASG